MKTKLHWLALIIVSAAFLSAPAQAGNNRHSNGNSAPAAAGARGGTAAARGNFSASGRLMMQGQRFSSTGVRSNAFHPNYIHPNGIASVGQRHFTSGTLNGGNRAGSIGSGNSVRNGGGNNHLFARRSGDWHRDWDRHHDHFWHGHRCRFVNSSWFIFDLGFFPWYGYPYDNYYPYAYGYGYDGYPNGYDAGVYEGVNPDYYDSRAGGSSDQYAGNNVAAAQERLARQGYYHGSIDGSYGPETRRAVMRYQRDHGLRVTGYLTADTLAALGLPREAS